MVIIFITGLYPIGKEEDFMDKCKNKTLQFASNEFQWRFVEGLYGNDADFHVISVPFLPSWPNYKDLYTEDGYILYKNANIGKYIKYCTFPFIKIFSLEYRLRKELKKYLNKFKDEQICIITYNSLGFMQKAVKPLKKKYNIKLISIITDLIDDATNHTFKLSTIKYIQAKHEQKRIWASYDYTDGFILLSKHMTERIPQAIDNNIVIEGIAKNEHIRDIVEKKDDIKTIVYTGSLAEFTGVRMLVDAFMQTTDSNFKLIICGKGQLTQYIEKCTKIDSRIEYKGIVPHNIATELQEKATAVINPRHPNGTITRYSFPSKTMEYLLSGTVMIGYRLEGIPDEYYEHFYSPSDLSTEALTNTINDVLNTSPLELAQKADRARTFIINNKTATKQLEKVLLFIKHLL